MKIKLTITIRPKPKPEPPLAYRLGATVGSLSRAFARTGESFTQASESFKSLSILIPGSSPISQTSNWPARPKRRIQI